MKLVQLTILGCLILFQSFIYSQTTYTLITSSSEWGNPNIWLPVGVPGPGDHIVIENKSITITSDQHIIAGFTIIDGNINFEGVDPTLTITDSAVWYDGEFDGGNGVNGTGNINSKLIINPGAKLVIDTDATPEIHRFYEGITVINQGTITCVGSSNISVRGLSVIQNEGLFDMQSDADFVIESFSGGTFLNSSTGIFRKSGGIDITLFQYGLNFQNESGTIEVTSGDLQFQCDGTFENGYYNASTGAKLSFLSHTQNFKGTLSGSPFGVVGLSGSTINIDSSGVVFDFQETGFQFSTGVITGGGTLTISSGSLLRLVPELVDPTPIQSLRGGTTLLNLGTIKQESNTTFGINGNSIVDNRSLFEILTDADFSGGTGSGGTFYNTGTFRKSGGNDVTQMNSWWKFYNQNGGVIDAASGELEFTMTGANFSNDPGAIIKGVASIDVPTSFTNNGITEPGSDIGMLSYIGNFVPSSTGVLDIQLGGLIAGTEYDQLNVTGNATLNGSLKVRVANGFVPSSGNSFIILNTSGTIDSNFVSLDIQDGLYLSVIKNSTNITLIVDSVGVLDVEEISDGEIVNDFSLSQNYPNPFNPSTNIQFALPQAGFVTLEVFSITGERVDVLISQELNAGKYNYEWNGSNLTSGIYFYRLNAGNFVETRKMMLLK